MAEDCESQDSVKFYLEAFFPYICENVPAKELLVHIPFFTTDERIEINKLSTKRPSEATRLAIEKFVSKNEPGKYREIKNAMGPERADIPKISMILSGKSMPTHEEENCKKVIDLFMKEIIDRINPREIISYLKNARVFGPGEEQVIESEETNCGKRAAAWLLLYYLPQRNEDWFKLFLKALIADNQNDLAEKLDPDLYTKIMAQTEISSFEEATIFGEKETTFEVVKEGGADSDLQNACTSKGEANIPIGTDETVLGKETVADESKPNTDLRLSEESSYPDSNAENLKFSIAYTVDGVTEEPKDNVVSGSLANQSERKSVYKKKVATDEYQQPYDTNISIDTDQTALKLCNSDGETAEDESTRNAVLQLSEESSHPDSSENLKFGAPYTGGGVTEKDNLLSGNLESQSERKSICEKSVATDGNQQPYEIYNRSRQAKTETVEDAESNENTSVKRIASLDKDVVTNDDAQNNDSFIPKSTGTDGVNEDNNNLNIIGPAPSIATDFDNIENKIETEIELREYQKELAVDGCEGENVVVLAPTNSGKTWVACKIIQDHFRRKAVHPNPKCAFVVENTALAQQQAVRCAELLTHLRTKVICGETQREGKEYLKDFVDRRDILVVTAKVLHNTLTKKEIESITKFSLIIFDECHHTQSDHPYNAIMTMYHHVRAAGGYEAEAVPQIVGLTASLGVGGEVTIDKAVEHIKSLMANLDARFLCRVRKYQEELEQYQNTPDEEIVIVPERENHSFRNAVSDVMTKIEEHIYQTREHLDPADLCFVNKLVNSIPTNKGSQPYIQWLSDLEKTLARLQSDDMRPVLNACRLHLTYYNDALLLYSDTRAEDALQLLDKKMEQRRKSSKTDTEQTMFQAYDELKEKEFQDDSFNPKLAKIQEILLQVLGKDEEARGIIFVKTRRLAKYLIKWMNGSDEFMALNPTKLVGQTGSDKAGGMTKNKQKDVLEYFEDGLHKLIVATSVAEEGLDITKCNLVIRYEHVTNEIVRTQSRGRARARKSRYYVITGQGSPIADKEEKNKLSEKLMNDAAVIVDNLIEEDRNNFESQLNDLQKAFKIKREMKVKKRAESLVKDEFTFQCFNCPNIICKSSEIRKVQGAHHVCIADTVTERVSWKRDSNPKFQENEMKMDGATKCKECNYTLGGVCDYKGTEYPLLKIQNFRVVDRNGKGAHYKKWKNAPCMIEEISLDRLKKI